jgi:6-phosphogluconolactonase
MKVHSLAVVLALVVVAIGCGSSSSHFLYVVGPGTSSVIGFQESSTGALNVLSSSFSTDAQPVSVIIHPSGKFVFTANFGAANLTIFDRDTGKGTMAVAKDPTTGNVIGPITVASNPIALAISPNGQFLCVLHQDAAPDPNNPGKVRAHISVFTVNGTSGNLTAVQGSPFFVPSGAASVPVSITVAANSKFVYVADPAQGIVAGFAFSSTGALSAMPGSPFTVGTAPAFVIVDPQAKFLYVADPPGNRIFGFSIDANTGVPTAISGSPFAAGTKPVSLAMDSTGAILAAANQGSNNVSAYSVNSGSGSLTPVSGSPFATGTAPVFVTVDFTNKFVYVGDSGTNDIAAFAISGGTLKAVTGSPFNIVTSPAWLVSR